MSSYCWDTTLAGVDETEAGTVLTLRPCRPNPTSGATEIAFDLHAPGHVSLDVHDVAGRLVTTLLRDEHMARGPRSVVWDSTDRRGQDVGSGVYFVRLSVDGYVATSKVVVAR